LMAQMLEAGTTRGLSTNPLVVKAAILNSADKNVLDRDFDPWEPGNVSDIAGVETVTQPLDTHSGAGLIIGLAAAQQYLSGEMAPGIVDPIGWDFHSIGPGQFIDYVIDPNLISGSTLSATLAWHRHVGRFDNGNGVIDASDSFFVQQALSNLNLQVLRNGSLIAQSISSVDNVEHLFFDLQQTAQYTLRVFGANVLGGSEQFAVAWAGLAVPEPASVVLVALAVMGWSLLGNRRSRSVAPALAVGRQEISAEA
ncbi:MAG: PEP-CTERM sorting domain-containing protein, partial [Pirellulales bacterium]